MNFVELEESDFDNARDPLPTATTEQEDMWHKQVYVRASRMSPKSTTPFVAMEKPSLMWLTVIVLIILNSVLFVLYVLDAIGVGFRSPLTLVVASGVLFILFCILSLCALWRFKMERIMQDCLRLVYITFTFTFVNFVSFLTILVWAIKYPGFWQEIDFSDDPQAHDGYIAANAFCAAMFVVALAVFWTAIVTHYYFVKLLETLNITILRAGTAGNLADIMVLSTNGGRNTTYSHSYGGSNIVNNTNSANGGLALHEQNGQNNTGEGSPYDPPAGEAAKWRG